MTLPKPQSVDCMSAERRFREAREKLGKTQRAGAGADHRFLRKRLPAADLGGVESPQVDDILKWTALVTEDVLQNPVVGVVGGWIDGPPSRREFLAFRPGRNQDRFVPGRLQASRQTGAGATLIAEN